jgi:ferredoxin
VKNLFGLIPGLEKVGYHTTLLERYDFSTMLFELADLIDPKLNIVDGIIGMEQDGPVSGALRRVGWIIVSDSPVLADIAVCKVIGWDLSYVPALSERAHIGDEAEWLGDDIEPLSPPFSLPSTFSPWRRLARFIKPLFTVQPVPSKRCDGCGLCADVCPRSAISIEERAEINDNACIRCYCCYELCPNQAIVLKRSFANKMVSYLSKKGIWPR